MAKTRTVMALADIEDEQVVAVDPRMNEAHPATAGTLEARNGRILARAMQTIKRGELGVVQELDSDF